MSKKVYIFLADGFEDIEGLNSSRPSPPRRNRYQNCIYQRNQTDPDISRYHHAH